MNNMVTDSGEVVYYVVRVDGQNITQPVSSQQLAEMEKMRLDPQQQQVAEVVPVTANGQQLLFG